jgi:hypothetical protein
MQEQPQAELPEQVLAEPQAFETALEQIEPGNQTVS